MIGPFITRARKSALLRNAGWLFAGQGLSFVAQAVYFIVLARLLGTTQYGLLAGAVALVAVVSQYSSLGSGLLFLRYERKPLAGEQPSGIPYQNTLLRTS